MGGCRPIRVEPTRVVQTFGPGSLLPLKLPDRSMRNYMYYRGGTLRFGKLTMSDADLALIDAHPEGPLRLLSGPLRAAAGGGLLEEHAGARAKVYMPDYCRVR